MYAKYKSQGLNVIAVNTQDSISDIQGFRAEFKLTMPLVTNSGKPESVAKAYGVLASPTNFVVDKNGKITASFIGYDEEGMKKALADLGIKL